MEPYSSMAKLILDVVALAATSSVKEIDGMLCPRGQLVQHYGCFSSMGMYRERERVGGVGMEEGALALYWQ